MMSCFLGGWLHVEFTREKNKGMVDGESFTRYSNKMRYPFSEMSM